MVPFNLRKNLLEHGNRTQTDLEDVIPIDYILDTVHVSYVNKKNFFIIEAATGSGKSFTLPLAFYKRYPNANTLILQPKILTVVQLRDDYTVLEGPAEKLVNKRIITGDNLSIKFSQQSISCRSDHCLTIGSYGSFIKRLIRDSNYINTFKVIILDEVHEDTPEIIDTLLFLYYNKAKKLPIIILTSATIQKNKFINYFDIHIDSIYKVAGNSYNKTIYYQDNDVDNITDAIVSTLTNIINNEPLKYDILIFVSSGKDIENFKDNHKIKNLVQLDEHVQIVGISREQILKNNLDYELYYKNNENTNLNNRKRMIIFGTNVAETGLTIRFLKYVINIGFEFKKEYVPYLNTYVFYNGPISKASETQRIGRVGRKFDGIAYNLYTKETSDAMSSHRSVGLIINKFSTVLLKNFNSCNFIDKLTIDLIYDSVHELYLLGFIKFNKPYTSFTLYDSITYTDEDGYMVDGQLSKTGLIAKKIVLTLDNDNISLNDVKLIIMSAYLKVDLYDIATIISMTINYEGTTQKNTNNDFIELLHIYNNAMKNKKTLHDHKLLKKTKLDLVVYDKHNILKTLYTIGFDVKHDNKIRLHDKDIKTKYIIEKLFYISYCTNLIVNNRYRNKYIIVGNGSKCNQCVTNKINLHKGQYKTAYVCQMDDGTEFNTRSYGLIY